MLSMLNPQLVVSFHNPRITPLHFTHSPTSPHLIGRTQVPFLVLLLAIDRSSTMTEALKCGTKLAGGE
jgi:hypothetical protein